MRLRGKHRACGLGGSRIVALRVSQVRQGQQPAAVLLLPGRHGKQSLLGVRQFALCDQAIRFAQRKPQALPFERGAIILRETGARARIVQPCCQFAVALSRGEQLPVAQAHANGGIFGMGGEPVLHEPQPNVRLAQADPFAPDRGEHLRIGGGRKRRALQ